MLYAVDGYEVAEGSTVFTVLRDFAEQNGIEYAYSGGTRSAYVTGIAGLHEFDHGKDSGWLYRVNGGVSACVGFLWQLSGLLLWRPH